MKPERFLAVVILALGCGVGNAAAAYPGRDGLLLVRPVTGPGLLLSDAHGGRQRRICLDAGCGAIGTPRWSPDGQLIAVATRGTPLTGPMLRLIYSDGSCFDCSLGGAAPAFETRPETLTSISGGFLHESHADGQRDHVLYRAPISDAVTSAGGRLAVVRRGRIQVPVSGHLVPVGTGSSPSWSADATRLAFVHRGWIEIVDLRHRHTVRLVRGSSPAWAPDGREIAYIAAGHSVRVIAPAGGRSRPVGRLRGAAVDWQPITRPPPAPCTPLSGTSVVTDSGLATLTEDPANSSPATPFSMLGCLTADGRQRVLTNFYGGGTEGAEGGFTDTALAGNFAALTSFTNYKADFETTVEVFDLRTGQAVPSLGGERPPSGCCVQAMNDLVLNSQGFTAVHTDVGGAEQIIASDNTGVHVLDSLQGSASTPALTGLAIDGDTLTWDHNGRPDSATLS